MNRLFPENSYMGKCSCGADFIAPKYTLHCSNCLYKRIVELEKDKINLIEEFAEAECLGEVAKISRQHGYEELKVGIKQ